MLLPGAVMSGLVTSMPPPIGPRRLLVDRTSANSGAITVCVVASMVATAVGLLAMWAAIAWPPTWEIITDGMEWPSVPPITMGGPSLLLYTTMPMAPAAIALL